MKPIFVGGDEAESWTSELDRIVEGMWTPDLDLDDPSEPEVYEEIELLAGIEIKERSDPT